MHFLTFKYLHIVALYIIQIILYDVYIFSQPYFIIEAFSVQIKI